MEKFIKAGINYYNEKYVKEIQCTENTCCLTIANTRKSSNNSNDDRLICFHSDTKEYKDLVKNLKKRKKNCTKKNNK